MEQFERLGKGCFSSVTRTVEELSVVCEAVIVPSSVRAERGWRSFRVAGRLDFSLTGVLASITAPLAAAQISVFAVSTFDTDYVLIRHENVAAAIACLRGAGHEVVSSQDRQADAVNDRARGKQIHASTDDD